MTSTSYKDPFNYPAVNRVDTMALQTIKQEDTGFLKHCFNNDRNFTLNVQDIVGNERIYSEKYLNKEHYQNKNADIQGSTSKQLIGRYTNKIHYSLQKDDIQGTSPDCTKFKTKRLDGDPQQPTYILPSYQQQKSQPTKFIRDPLYIDDIEGTKGKPVNIGFKPRNMDPFTHIEGTSPRHLTHQRAAGGNDNLDVKDINNQWVFQSDRHNNPLEPAYINRDTNNNIIKYGFVKGSKSKPRARQVNKNYDCNLTNDLPGAKADTANYKNLNLKNRQEWTSTNNHSDIAGSHVNTLKIGIQTNRNINPLEPNYNMPGATESKNEYDFTRPVQCRSPVIDAKKEFREFTRPERLYPSKSTIVQEIRDIEKIRNDITRASDDQQFNPYPQFHKPYNYYRSVDSQKGNNDQQKNAPVPKYYREEYQKQTQHERTRTEPQIKSLVEQKIQTSEVLQNKFVDSQTQYSPLLQQQVQVQSPIQLVDQNPVETQGEQLPRIQSDNAIRFANMKGQGGNGNVFQDKERKQTGSAHYAFNDSYQHPQGVTIQKGSLSRPVPKHLVKTNIFANAAQTNFMQGTYTKVDTGKEEVEGIQKSQFSGKKSISQKSVQSTDMQNLQQELLQQAVQQTNLPTEQAQGYTQKIEDSKGKSFAQKMDKYIAK